MSTSDERSRSIYYRRVIWPEELAGEKLEGYLVEAHKKLKTSDERDFGTEKTRYQGVDFKIPESGGILLRVGKYAPGEEGSTIKKPSKASAKGAIGTQKPDAGSEFMDGDIFVYVNENHVFLLPSGASEGSAASYIKHTLKALDKGRLASLMSIKKIANADKAKVLQKEGVKRVVLNSALYDASLLPDDAGQAHNTILARVAEAAKAVIYKDKQLSEIRKHENLNVQVSLSFDGAAASRKKDEAYGDEGRERLFGLGSELVNDDDAEDFVIYTNGGKTIKSSEINIKETVDLPKYGKTVQQSEAWSALLTYHESLKALGVLEQ